MLVTSGEAATLCETDEGTIRKRIRSGKLPAVKVGRQWLVDGESVGAHIQPRATNSRTIVRRRGLTG